MLFFRKCTAEMNEKHSQLLSEPIDDLTLRASIQSLVSEVHKSANKLKNTLLEMHRNTTEMIQKLPNDASSASRFVYIPAGIRMRENMHCQLSRRFKDALQGFGETQKMMVQRERDTTARRLKMVCY